MTSPDSPAEGTTILEILGELETEYPGQMIANADGTIRCTACDRTTAAADFAVDGYRRLEGASDAADLTLIVWAACAHCGAGGSLTLGYGPNASPSDTAVLPDLDLGNADEPGATP